MQALSLSSLPPPIALAEWHGNEMDEGREARDVESCQRYQRADEGKLLKKQHAGSFAALLHCIYISTVRHYTPLGA